MELILKVKEEKESKVKILKFEGFSRQSLVSMQNEKSKIEIFHTSEGLEIKIEGNEFKITWESFAEGILQLNNDYERSL